MGIVHNTQGHRSGTKVRAIVAALRKKKKKSNFCRRKCLIFLSRTKQCMVQADLKDYFDFSMDIAGILNGIDPSLCVISWVSPEK